MMSLLEDKIRLAKIVLETENPQILVQISELLETQEKDFWVELSNHVKEGIERGIQQAKDGLLTPHDEVMKKYEKYL